MSDEEHQHGLPATSAVVLRSTGIGPVGRLDAFDDGLAGALLGGPLHSPIGLSARICRVKATYTQGAGAVFTLRLASPGEA